MLRLPLKEAQCLAVCRLAVEELGWLLQEQGRGHPWCRGASRLLAFHRPVRLLIVVDPAGKTVTRVRLRGKVFGFRPAARAVQRDVHKLATHIERTAAL
jgi:hypothetical protein